MYDNARSYLWFLSFILSGEEGKLDFQTDTPQDTIGIDHGRGFIDTQGPERGQSVESLASLSMVARQLPAQLESQNLQHGVNIKWSIV